MVGDMPMQRLAFALLLVMLGAAPAMAAPFARHGVKLKPIYGSPRPMTVTAPDGRTRAVARYSDFSADDSDARLAVFIGGEDHGFPGGPNAELLWAPHSRAIAVTANDGGAGGGYETAVLVRPAKGHHWRQIDLTDRVSKLFASQMRCDGDEEPNIAAIGWTSGRRLIVVAQVPLHSSCSNMGSFTGYVVDVPSGDVLMEIDRASLRRHYARMLGSALAPSKHRHRQRSHHLDRSSRAKSGDVARGAQHVSTSLDTNG
jgi:hypothetical protein